MMTQKIISFAKEQGYDDAAYLGEWRGFAVYEPLFAQEDATVGPPLVILERAGVLRMSTVEESFDCLREMPVEEE